MSLYNLFNGVGLSQFCHVHACYQPCQACYNNYLLGISNQQCMMNSVQGIPLPPKTLNKKLLLLG